jgi:hypothetical protein
MDDQRNQSSADWQSAPASAGRMLIRRHLKSNRMADYQSATQQTDSLRYNTDL